MTEEEYQALHAFNLEAKARRERENKRQKKAFEDREEQSCR